MRFLKSAHFCLQRGLDSLLRKACVPSADTSEPACVNPEYIVDEQKARPYRPSSRKYSAIVRPVSPTLILAPGGSFICPKTMVVLSDNPRFLHFIVKVISFSGPLTYAGEYGVSAVLCGDIADQLLDQNGLAYAGAAKQTDLAALLIRGRAGQQP